MRAPAILGACLHLLTHARAMAGSLLVMCCMTSTTFIRYTTITPWRTRVKRRHYQQKKTKDTTDTDTEKEESTTNDETSNETNDLDDKLAEKEASDIATTDAASKNQNKHHLLMRMIKIQLKP